MNSPSEDPILERYIRRVSQLVGYDSPPPAQIRAYIVMLKGSGYAASAAARQVRTFLEANTL